MQGWIKLHRQIQDHWLYKEKRTFSRYEAWIDLLMMASHKDTKFVLGNELIELEKGSFVTSELKLMERWHWGKSKLRSFLEILEKDGMIVKNSDRKKTTISICNYSIYHDLETENRPQADQEQTASRLPADTIKNDKNDKNDKNKDSRPKQLYDETSVYYQLALLLYNEILKNMPDKKKPNLNQWADSFRKLVELDNKKSEHIEKVIKWAQSNGFWWKNVLSATKFREQYERLAAELRDESKNGRKGKVVTKKQAIDFTEIAERASDE